MAEVEQQKSDAKASLFCVFCGSILCGFMYILNKKGNSMSLFWLNPIVQDALRLFQQNQLLLVWQMLSLQQQTFSQVVSVRTKNAMRPLQVYHTRIAPIKREPHGGLAVVRQEMRQTAPSRKPRRNGSR